MSKHVLVVDDSACVRLVIRHILEGRGYTVSEAQDPEQALRYLAGRTVQVIISDVHMPKMDGIEFVKTVKQLPAHRLVPTLMLTAESGSRAKALGKAAGVRAWMVKPFAPSMLLKMVDLLSGGPAFAVAP